MTARLFATTLAFAGLFCLHSISHASDWSQWRGPDRNGVVLGGPPLADSWPEDGPAVLWDSEMIPSVHDGGYGSVIVSGNRAYLSVVWHTDEPTETRAINASVLRELGFQKLKLDPELIKKMETARLSLNKRLRGSKLDEWTEHWLKEHLNHEQKKSDGNYIKSRFRKGSEALPYEILQHLSTIQKRVFENTAALHAWLDAQGYSEDLKEKILKKVPPTHKIAQDVIICLDATSGKTVWKFQVPGEPTGRKSSSTPCVSRGRVYGIGSTHAYCLDERSGEIVWSIPLDKKGAGTSPMVTEGRFIIADGHLKSYEVETGKLVWEHEKLKCGNSSPTLWKTGGTTYLIYSASKEIACINFKTGETVWTCPGGGDSTPVIHDNYLIAYTQPSDLGLAAYQISPEGAELLWNHAFDARRALTSPIVRDDHVYLMGSSIHVCVNLKNGEIAWEKKTQSNISSPVLVDGKIVTLDKKGNYLSMLRATPDSYEELATARVGALICPSPAIVDGKLYLRLPDRIRCYNLAEPTKGSTDLL